MREARENLRKVREKEEKAKRSMEGDKDATCTVSGAVTDPGGGKEVDVRVQVRI